MKRAATDSQGSSPKPKCMFGLKCFRRNPVHFKDYSHPHIESLLGDESGLEDRIRDLVLKGADEVTVRDQLEVLRNTATPSKQAKIDFGESSSTQDSNSKNEDRSKPASTSGKLLYYLTKIKDSPNTHRGDKRSLYITDLLRPSGGVKLKETLQINFMVDFEWLWMNYEAANIQNIPLTILYGEDNAVLMNKSELPSNVTAAKVRMASPFGTHHTKMMIFVYDDNSVRVIVSTANLVPSDWENRTQGVWVGQRCPKATGLSRSDGDSATGFKSSLLRYLNFYQMVHLTPFISAIECCDFSQVNVFFIASVPGSHSNNFWGHTCMRTILRKHLKSDIATKHWPLVAQCSSIGSLGPTPESWLENEFSASLGLGSKEVKLVYPTKQNVFASYDGVMGGGCLPYSRSTHVKQPWLCDHMFIWKSDSYDRSRAMPHIKTFTKISPDNNSLAYVLLTSANLSKAAWGTMNKAGDKLMIRSYEAGVLFLPKFTSGGDVFDVNGSEFNFLLPYDIPVTKFSNSDTPWLMDYLYEAMK